MARRLKWIFVVLAVFLTFDTAALLLLLKARQSPAAIVGKTSSYGTASVGGPFTLMTTAGRTVTDQTYRGKWMLIYFGYTHCPDDCPTALNNLSVALRTLEKTAQKIQPLFITVDPRRDTRQVMSAFLKPFDPRIVGLVGDRPQIDAAAKEYRVYVKRRKTRNGDYIVGHSAYFYLMGPDGKFVDVLEGSTPGDQLAAKMRKLIEGHPAT